MLTFSLAEVIFALTLLATFAAAALGRLHEHRHSNGALGEEKLNRWLVGLSAGTTANSGFIVTGAVGLGYLYGVQWLLLPLSWLLGDLIFWKFFPARLNRLGQTTRAVTLSQLLTHGLKGPAAIGVSLLAAALVLLCLGAYTTAQWLAGQTFLSGAFGLSGFTALLLFGTLIIAYSAIGGFRGSVYTDALQAVIRLLGTGLALGAVATFAWADSTTFQTNLAAAGPTFLHPFPGGAWAMAGFIGGFAMAAIGFGLGQPQIVSRYLAGRTPDETRSARWIYIGFVQFTWLSMTLFGILLRGVMPGLTDAEAGLSLFFRSHMGPITTGLIVADVFATIAATSNGILVAMAQTTRHDLLPRIHPAIARLTPLWLPTLLIGLITMAASLHTGGTVVSLALGAVSLLGSGLAGAVMIRALGWPHTALSLMAAILSGFLTAVLWRQTGFGAWLNEAAVGIPTGLATAMAVAWLTRRSAPR